MKKNKMMRLASALLVAVLLTTCTISGTYAKYVTKDSATDSARVAQWGVVVTATGELFDETYKTTSNTPGNGADDTGGTVLSVESKSGNIIAPGTKNEEGITFSITGTPEVDVDIDVKLEGFSDVFLLKGTYEDGTTGNDEDFFAFDEDYYPVVYTLKKNGSEVATGTLKTIESTLEAFSKTVDANNDLATEFGNFNLTWKWDYTQNPGIEEDDQKDTVLGNLATGTVKYNANTTAPADWDAFMAGAANAINGTQYSLNTGATITVTVTQID